MTLSLALRCCIDSMSTVKYAHRYCARKSRLLFVLPVSCLWLRSGPNSILFAWQKSTNTWLNVHTRKIDKHALNLHTLWKQCKQNIAPVHHVFLIVQIFPKQKFQVDMVALQLMAQMIYFDINPIPSSYWVVPYSHVSNSALFLVLQYSHFT